MTRTAVRKGMALVLGGLLVMGSVVGLGLTPMLELNSHSSEYMTLAEWHHHRVTHEEDEAGWDCRVDGNMMCGAPDNAAYDLVCPQYDVPNQLCHLHRYAFDM